MSALGLSVPVPGDRVTATVMRVLCGALAAVYLFTAITMPSGHAAVAAGEAGIAMLQLAWLAATRLRPGAARVHLSGVVLQVALTALWIITRTVGLPGTGRLPVGEFDLLCAMDALMIAVLCWRSGPWGRAGSPRVRLGICQLAVILAASTAYMSMASMMAMASPAIGHSGAASHGGPGQTFFCHLL